MIHTNLQKLSLNAYTMIKNYFKIAWRNLLRHKAYSAINIAGLAVGIAASLLIFIVVKYELGYDKFQKNKSSIIY